jgi:disulfide bond formation protein DsbB
MGTSLYHYLLIKTDWFPPPPCLDGVPCTVDYFNILGFINIPFMALVAFFIITVMMVASHYEPYAQVDDPGEINGIRAFLAPAAYPVLRWWRVYWAFWWCWHKSSPNPPLLTHP